ncbi:MAG: ABC transporter permease [Anaerolineae bacterium]
MADQPEYLTPPSALGAFIRRNPVALKELRGRMRGARACVVLSVYAVLMSLFTLILYGTYSASQAVTLSTSGGVIGKLIFGAVVAIELFLVCFISPAFTSGAISGERERQTFDLLRTTLLPAERIVSGKLISALAYVQLLLLVAVPLQSLAFLMGGVTIEEVLLSIWILIVSATGYASVGVFFSASTQRTLNASVLTYAFALAVTVALPIGTAILAAVGAAAGASDQVGLEALMIYGTYLLAATNPIATAVLTEVNILNNGGIFVLTQSLSNGTNVPLVQPWIPYTLFMAFVTVVMVRLSVRAIRRASLEGDTQPDAE